MVDVEIDIEANDDASPTINIITNNVTNLHQAVQREERQERSWEKSLKRIRDRTLGAVRAVSSATATVAGLTSAAGPAVSVLLAAGKALAVVGKSTASLLPLVAFLPSLVGAFALVKTTLKLAGPGLAKAFEPVTRVFVDAKGKATAFAKALQRAVAIDVRPAAEGFAKLNLPAITHNMDRIAYQTNLIVAGTLRWANSARGVAAIKAIADSTGDAVTKLVPHVLRLVAAFGDLAGKAGGRAITGLGDAIGRVLDKLSAWAETHDLDDINKALNDLGGYGLKLRQVFGVVRDVGRWLAENEGAVKHFSDVAAGAAIALGVATGNVPAVVAGAVSLIINHWNELKGPFASAVNWVKDMADAWQRDAGRIKVAEAITRALQAGREAFLTVIAEIGPKWREFTAEIARAWKEWAPLVTAWWNNGGKTAFVAAGAAIGFLLMGLLQLSIGASQAATMIAQAFKFMAGAVLNVLGTIINGAAKAFGWMPGIGPKLRAAADEFEAFKNSVNRALNGIDQMKTIRINASVYVTGGGPSGQSDQRTGNSRQAGLGALTSWQRAAAAFAGERGGSRTGGPTPVTATVQNNLYLDGRPFRAYTDRVTFEERRRNEWRLAAGVR